jgi:protein TonB
LLLVISAFEYRFYVSEPAIPKQDLQGPEILDMVDITIHKPPRPKVINPKVIEVKTEAPDPEDIDIVYTPNFDDPADDISDIMADIPKEKPDEIVDFTEVMPEPRGGYETFYKYLGKELKYPKKARQLRIKGKVYLSFVVERDGSVTNIELMKGIGGGCDEEAIRVLENAPAWNPGRQGRYPVRVRMTMPFVFKLQ